MSEAPSSTERIVRFGVFELDQRTGELRKAGLKLGLQDQPLHVLTMLLERPGELVTRDELKERLWPAQTFVDFEQGLNAAVKRLRSVLGDSADTPRFIETLPRRGYRFIAPLDGIAGSHATPAAPRRTRRLVLAAALTAIALALAAVVVVRRGDLRPPSSRPRVLARLTFDPGLQMQPTWSPDGRFIAYASDKSGNLDIWVQPIAGGDAVQITKDPAHDSEPNWSPDGRQIAFRSERQGGGLFLVPVLGGDERRLATFGYRPRWSPDGTRVLFAGTGFPDSMGIPSMYLVSLDGSSPRRIHEAFLAQFRYRPAVAWHPDGRRLSFWGPHREAGPSVWTVPVDGGAPVRSELAPQVQEAMAKASLENYERDDIAWAPSGRTLFFVGTAREVTNLWKVDVDPATLRWIGGPERLTAGPGVDKHLALSPDGRTIAFATSTRNSRIWEYPFNALVGQITGEGRPLTPPESNSIAPHVSRDGRKVLFFTEQPGRVHQHRLTEMSLPDGAEHVLAVDDYDQGEDRRFPRWSPDGTRVAYRYQPPRTHPPSCSIYVLDSATGLERQLTSPFPGCNDTAYDWSADGRWIVAAGGRYVPKQAAIVFLPLHAAPRAESQARIVTSDGDHVFANASISPNDRWIAFRARRLADPRVATVYVVARSGGTWTQVTEGASWDDKPRWSPDGRAIYFVSSRGGEFNVWGIRFDPILGLPVGDAFPVTSYTGPRRVIVPTVDAIELGVARDRLILPLRDVTGGIWTLENVDR